MTAGKKTSVEFVCRLCRNIEHIVEEVFSISGKKGKGGSPKDEPHIKGKAIIEEMLHYSSAPAFTAPFG